MADKDPKEVARQRSAEMYARAADLIGADNLKKLEDAGLGVVITSDLNNFVLAYSREAKRIRDLHAQSEKDAGRTSARVEVIPGDGVTTVTTLLVTSPACNEERLATLLEQALGPVCKDIQAVRFQASALRVPEPIRPLPPVNARGGGGMS